MVGDERTHREGPEEQQFIGETDEGPLSRTPENKSHDRRRHQGPRYLKLAESAAVDTEDPRQQSTEHNAASDLHHPASPSSSR
jgi:hypothetical protein